MTTVAASNILEAFEFLKRSVRQTLLTRQGDAACLQQQCREVDAFMVLVEQHSRSFPAETLVVLRSSMSDMLRNLEQANHQSADPPDQAPVLPSLQRNRARRRGRPKIEIPPNLLSNLMDLQNQSQVAALFNCSSRTIRRRALEHGIRQPGEPVCTTVNTGDGNQVRIYTSTAPVMTNISDEQLDNVMAEMLVQHNFGRALLRGRLLANGIRVSHVRQRESYRRVHGPTRRFSDRRIHRRKYKVAGPNSLWHHDGQHGLIKYKIVFHCFIDGFSRLITALGVHTNNRAQTVLDLFLKGTEEYGIPSRVRGDHGTENLLVADWMENTRGLNRGSYLWGRSVHNTRIERLWFELTRSFGAKWKDFFIDLEHNHSLNPSQPSHIWLIHHLFLSGIKEDARSWAASWNCHKLNLGEDEADKSPLELFTIGTFQHGARGIDQLLAVYESKTQVDESTYGVDPIVYTDTALALHFGQNNPEEDNQGGNPFVQYSRPQHMANVECEAPNCPFTKEEIMYLDATLATRVDLKSQVMDVRRLVWIEAMRISGEIYNTNVAATQ